MSKKIELKDDEAALILRNDGAAEIATPSRIDELEGELLAATASATLQGQICSREDLERFVEETAERVAREDESGETASAVSAASAIQLIRFMATCRPLVKLARAMMDGDAEVLEMPAELATAMVSATEPSGDPKEWN
jgi:hypothetical protein